MFKIFIEYNKEQLFRDCNCREDACNFILQSIKDLDTDELSIISTYQSTNLISMFSNKHDHYFEVYMEG